MASTILAFDLIEDSLPSKVYLTAAEDGLTAPDASGYTLTLSGTIDWRYTATATEALSGVYRAHIHDGDGNTIAQGYIWIEADDTGTYIAGPDFNAVMGRKALATVDTNVDAILVDTNELQSGWTTGGALELILSAILEDTSTTLNDMLVVIDGIVDAILVDTSATLNDMLVDILQDTSATLPDLITAGPTGGVVSPIGGLEIIRNDSYDATTGKLQISTNIDFTSYAGPHIFTIKHRVLGTQLLQETSGVTVVDEQTIEVELSTSDTAFSTLTTDADFGLHPYDLQMVNGSSIKTIRGVATIKKDQTT